MYTGVGHEMQSLWTCLLHAVVDFESVSRPSKVAILVLFLCVGSPTIACSAGSQVLGLALNYIVERTQLHQHNDFNRS